MDESRWKVSLSGLIAGLAALLGVAGIIAQVISYVAAREFYNTLGLEPTAVGITPLNAALRLTRTAGDIVIDLMTWILPAGLIAAVSVMAFNVWRGSRDTNMHAALRAAAKLQTSLTILERNDPLRIRNIAGRRELREAITVQQARAEKLRPGSLSKLQWRKIRVVLIFPIVGLILVQGVAAYVGARASALQLAVEMLKGEDPSKYNAPVSLKLDLLPTRVTVQWYDDAKVPISLVNVDELTKLTADDVAKMSADDLKRLAERMKARVFSAYELGNVDGRSVLWFRRQHVILTINNSDIAVERTIF